MAKTTLTAESLFPILNQDQSPQLPVGIARMAFESTHTDDGHLIEFRTLKVRSVLSRIASKRITWMAWGINPYRGCEFACRYCYARYTHEFMAPGQNQPPQPGQPDFRDPNTFERLIFLKQNAAWLLEQELRRHHPTDHIAIGTATDPWQPIERRARITRSLLEVFARHSGYNIGIVTKSRLVLRDTDLLQEINRRNRLTVHITITTPDAALARLLEPRAPRPDLRFDTVRRLRQAGITTGILCSPLLPGITDTEEAIDRMARHSAEANASFFAANPLFLKPCSRPTYLSFVQEHFPHLVPDYHRRFDRADFAPKSYTQHLSHLVAVARERHGLNRRWREDYDDLVSPTEPSPGPVPEDPRPPDPEIHAARKPPRNISSPQQQSLFA
ncbi:radical SAM protein [Edaphobacter sp. HDX4]|uniref:SPL family radical SAM protein n=1 Tax=Edaphobacter sp. HDX4 TaxID=2794064 RepID=UPI002FE6195C